MSFSTASYAPTSFWSWREYLKGQARAADGAGAAAEPESDYTNVTAPLPVNEHLVQLIWAQQLLAPGALRTLAGVPVRVLDPGRWNGAAGPDFKGARIMLGEATLHGDIEIHLTGPEWQAHGHQRDLDYNGVILHVVLRSADAATDDPLHNGARVPRLELEPYIFPDLETLRRSLTPDDYDYAEPTGAGRCHRLMTGLPPEELAAFLDHAGDERLVAKMQRLDQHGAGDAEQLFYQSLLLSLGTGAGRTLYYLLAKRVPLADALAETRPVPETERPRVLESLLLHVAGLVPGLAELESAATTPIESRERAEVLARDWTRLAPYWSDRVIPPTRRWFNGIRPVNFATRRLAGLAVLLTRALREERLPFADLLERLRAGAATLDHAAPTRRKHPLLKELTGRLTVAGEGHFWGTHYSFTAAPSARAMDLIGEGAAQSLVLNAFLPAALWQARQTGDEVLARAARQMFALFPPLQPNHITTFMARRLFGDDAQAHQLINTERRRQGLFQVFYHCCKGESAHCEACYLFHS